jgi:O-glycosyl hydrolase
MAEVYEVNIGNIGNIPCDTKGDAVEIFEDYVKQSQEGYGRVGEENVVMMVDGEPNPAYDFDWFTWKIQKERRLIVRLETELWIAKGVLDKLLERLAEACND